MYQARYLSGIVAGKMTKSNVLGYVAAQPISKVIRGINAFTLGAQSVNPNVQVKVVWTNTWYDPAAEKEAAKSLLTAGADIITQEQDTPSAQQAAQDAGKYGIGFSSDMKAYAPKAELTAPIWNWGPYYAKVVEAVKNGTWKTGQDWPSIQSGIVDLAPYGDMVPQDVRTLVDQKKQDLANGKFDVFWGPIKAQDGQTKVAEGQKMSDDDMLNMNWFVKGVVGTIPK